MKHLIAQVLYKPQEFFPKLTASDFRINSNTRKHERAYKALRLTGPAPFTRFLKELVYSTEIEKGRHGNFIDNAIGNSGKYQHKKLWKDQIQEHIHYLQGRQRHKVLNLDPSEMQHIMLTVDVNTVRNFVYEPVSDFRLPRLLEIDKKVL